MLTDKLEKANKTLGRIKDSDIFKNSIYITLATLSNAGFGFLFWVAAAQFYSDSEVGVATAIISSFTLIVMFARLGLHQSIIRYFPDRDQHDVFTSSIIASLVVTLGLGVLFIPLTQFITPAYNLSIVEYSGVLFVVFLLSSSAEGILGRSLLALKRGKNYFVQKLLLGLKIAFVIVFSVIPSAFVIFAAWGTSFLVSNLYSLYQLRKNGVWISKVNMNYLKDSFNYSWMNYLISLFLSSPNHILPIIVVGIVGPESAAYYYISHRIAQFGFTIPLSFSVSMFVEGSHGSDLKKDLKKATATSASVLSIFVLVIVVFGNDILNVIGESYTEGYQVMVLMTLSGFFIMGYRFFLSIQRVQKKLHWALLITGLLCISLISTSIVLIQMVGIVGVGYAWLLSYGLANGAILFYVAIVAKN